MTTPSVLVLANSLATTASPVELETRQSCPGVHVFGARETTVSPGYGSSATVVNLILGAYPGSTSEAITYPACGGQASCGGIAYGTSANQGTAAVASAVNSFHSRCPDTKMVLVGYSQVSIPHRWPYRKRKRGFHLRMLIYLSGRSNHG